MNSAIIVFLLCVIVAACLSLAVNHTINKNRPIQKVIKRAEELRDQGRCEEALKYLHDNKPKW